MERGELSSLMLTVPTLVDPSLAPPGEQLFNCVALVDRGHDAHWSRSKEATIELLVERIDKVQHDTDRPPLPRKPMAQPGTGSLSAIYSGLRAASVALGRPAEHLGPAT